MHISASRTHAAIDRPVTQHKAAKSDDAVPASAQSAVNAMDDTVILSASPDTSNDPPASDATAAGQSTATDQPTTGETPGTSENEDDSFQADARSLAEQIKSILNDIKNRKKKGESSDDGDIQSTQNALDPVAQFTA